MLRATQLPIDPYGNLIPVACHKSRATQVLTLANAGTVYASNAFSGFTKKMASLDLTATGETITITSKLEGWEGEEISVTVAAAAGALSVAVAGKAITITPKADSTSAQVAAAIAANMDANALVSATPKVGAAVIDAPQAKAYLNGWDRGNVGIYVMIQASEDIFYGTFSEAETGAASIPLPAGAVAWEYVMPGHKLSAKSEAAGAKVYLTPAKQM